MREEELKRVLLVKAVEETDRESVLVPPADRASASREAKRAVSGEGGALPISRRAELIHARIVARHPFLDEVLRHASGIAGFSAAAIAVALLLGLGLAVLDGSRRINILAYPLAALVAWNLAVYIVIAINAGRGTQRKARWLPEAASRGAARRLAGWVARSRSFNTPLSEALGKFALEWQVAARPLLVARAARTFHLAAAAVGVGLIAGLYMRGIAFAYSAGWESTFLDAERARMLIGMIYGPASALTGIAIPDAVTLETLRWRNGQGGEPAGRWIHLLAASALLFVVIPRLALAAIAGLTAARHAANLPLPPEAAAYARGAFGAFGGLDDGVVRVVPYAYEPDAASVTRLQASLRKDLGGNLALQVRAPVPYGGEDAWIAELAASSPPPDALVVLLSLAATPEDENHGRILEGARDALERMRPGAPFVPIVDEGPYLARMGSGPRVDERRRAWATFITARGLQARFQDLSQ